MENQDKKIISACITEDVVKLFNCRCEFPLDADIIDRLKELDTLISDTADDYEIYRHRDIVDELWGALLEKAIKCLRYFDRREPFSKKEKKTPIAYGIEDLKEYYSQYTEFEKVLYGTGRYYRDHVIHVFRTWLSGVEQLTKNGGDCLNHIAIKEGKVSPKLRPEEKLSVWTIIALTHDLGYPLEKAKSIIDITKKMVSTFISNPDISMDLSFHGVQNYMNDYVVRLMSSKMVWCPSDQSDEGDGESSPEQELEEEQDEENLPDDSPKKCYAARLQSKYYFKFQKSLERNNHGILSTLIIYKLLTYFLESDYSINEDYYFTKEDCRQFYIRREILRAIASHTCNDVYQMYMGSFSFLLRICDDTQEWGRKNISELYVKSEQHYELSDIALTFGKNKGENNQCKIAEEINVADKESVKSLIHRFHEQTLIYITIFRDGQDTSNRDFAFHRQLQIKTGTRSPMFSLNLDIHQDEASYLGGTITYASTRTNNSEYGPAFFEELEKDYGLKSSQFKIFDEKNNEIEPEKPELWHIGKFELPLF